MDDSMDAFELPSLSRKKFFLSRKKRNCSPIPPEDEKQTSEKQIRQNDCQKNFKSNTGKTTIQNDDTLAEIADLTDEVIEIKNAVNTEEVIVSQPNHDVNLGSNDEVSSAKVSDSPGGFCKICSQPVPKEECKTHYIQCMKEKFASKQDLKLRIESSVTCPTCNMVIDVKKYEDHCLICRPSSSNHVASKTRHNSESEVTSSYFGNVGETPVRKKNEPCPSCNMNLAGFTLAKKRSHINRCLDNQIELEKSMALPNRSSSKINLKQLKIQSDSVESREKCPKCKKAFKTKGYFKRHVESCTGQPGSRGAKRKGEGGKRTARNPRSADEEILQVAKALSKSEAEERKMAKKREKLKKKEVPVPVMLQESPATRKAALEARLVGMIGKSDDATTSTDDCEVPCTPTIPLPSKWGQQEISNYEQSCTDMVDAGECVRSPVGVKPFVELKPEYEDQSSPKLEISSSDSDDEPVITPVMASKFAFVQQSKWHLSNGKSSQNVDYRVSGLLTQFEGPAKPMQINGDPTTDENSIEAISDKINMEDDENMDSTLQQLIDLGRSPSEVRDDDPYESADISKETEYHKHNMVEETLPLPDNSRYIDAASAEIAHIDNAEKTVLPGNKSSVSVSYHDQTVEERENLVSLQSDLSTLVNCKIYSDLTLRFDNNPDDDVPVHKCVLFCRLPTLLQAFETSSNGDGIVHITHLNKDEVLRLLDFIYTGSLKKISRMCVTKLVNEFVEREFASKTKTERNESGEKPNPTDPNTATTSFVPSDDDLFHNTPSPCNGSILGNSPTVRLTDFRSGLDDSIEIRMDDDDTERIYLTGLGDSDATNKNNGIMKSPGISKREKSPVSSNKRRSVHFTPLPGNKMKFRRMTGSTPKSPLVVGRPPASTHDTPIDIHDFSSIASHSPHPGENLHNSPALKIRHQQYCPETPRHRVYHDVIDGATHSQPTCSASGPDDDVFVASYSQPLPDTNELHESNNWNDNTYQFTVNDSVLLSAAVGQPCVPAIAAGPSGYKTPVAVRKPRQSFAAVPFTPMPNYSDMDTPDVIRQGKKMGLKRTLGKKKLKVKLKELYRYHHQVVSSDDEEQPKQGEVTTVQLTPNCEPPLNDDIEIVDVIETGDFRGINDVGADQVEVMKAEKNSRRAIKALESLSTDEFAQLFKQALNAMQRKETMLKALQRAQEATRGIARGSSDDVQRWLHSVTPSSPHYCPEFTVLASLCSDKQQAIVESLSAFVSNEPTVAPFHQHMFDILPTVYRVMTRINPGLLAKK